MKVRVNQKLVYDPCNWDRIYPTANNDLTPGKLVRVVNLPGAPKANTMGHCYVEEVGNGSNVVLVHTNSLHTQDVYVAYLREKMAQYEAIAKADNIAVNEVAQHNK